MFEGLVAALVSGGFGMLVLLFQQRGKKSALADAWLTQAQQLVDRLDDEHRHREQYLEGQIVALQDENARLTDAVITRGVALRE